MGKKKTPTPASTPAATNAGDSGPTGPYDEVRQGYSQFAQTGGFSPADLANIRARAVSPVRAVYANAQREANRSKALQGGYSPGFSTLQARMAREQGQGISDAATGAESNIAKMVQEGKLSGLQGLSGLIGSGGGGGGGDSMTPEPDKKKGFWGKFGTGLKKVGQVALPIALGAVAGPPGAVAGKFASSALGKVGQSAARQYGVK
jgi:hypothetical protein